MIIKFLLLKDNQLIVFKVYARIAFSLPFLGSLGDFIHRLGISDFNQFSEMKRNSNGTLVKWHKKCTMRLKLQQKQFL